jgi:hypothetical protein
MITGFTVGKWYKWVGPKDYAKDWTAGMEQWKDGTPRVCVYADKNQHAGFMGIINSYYYAHCLEHFVELPMLEKWPMVSRNHYERKPRTRRKKILSRMTKD